MEIWDLYDENRRLTGETAVRGRPLPRGRYHLIANVLFLNSKGETLLQHRAEEKEIMPGIWSVTGGSALQGEDSAAACVRDTREEMGFTPDMRQARVLRTERREREDGGFFRDVWLVRQDVPPEAMRYQSGEVQGGMWILPEDITKDARLNRDLNELFFWEEAFPYLCLESMRIRIPKGVYRHCKGRRYEVLDLCLHSETMEPMVIYRALYDGGEIWTRPAAMWGETVCLPDGLRKRRFEREEEM